MIETLSVDGFRGLDGVTVDPLARFNVLVGPGGSGKTTLLEAAYFLNATGDASILNVPLTERGLSLVNRTPGDAAHLLQRYFSIGRDSFEIAGTWAGTRRQNIYRSIQPPKTPLAPERAREGIEDPSRTIAQSVAAIQLETDHGGTRYIGQLYVTPKGLWNTPADASPLFKTIFSGVTFHRAAAQALAPFWTQVEDRGEAANVETLVRRLDPNVEAVRVAANFGEAYLRIHHRRLGPIRPEFLGEGFTKALSLSCLMVSTSSGVLFVDEIDASLHVGALHVVIKSVIEAARRLNVQVFCSTHSLETVDAFIDLCDPLDDLRVIQLFRPERNGRVHNLDGRQAKQFREEIGLDLRRTG